MSIFGKEKRQIETEMAMQMLEGTYNENNEQNEDLIFISEVYAFRNDLQMFVTTRTLQLNIECTDASYKDVMKNKVQKYLIKNGIWTKEAIKMLGTTDKELVDVYWATMGENGIKIDVVYKADEIQWSKILK